MTEAKKLSDEFSDLLSLSHELAALLSGANNLLEEVVTMAGGKGMYAQDLIQMALAKAEAITTYQGNDLLMRILAMEEKEICLGS